MSSRLYIWLPCLLVLSACLVPKTQLDEKETELTSLQEESAKEQEQAKKQVEDLSQQVEDLSGDLEVMKAKALQHSDDADKVMAELNKRAPRCSFQSPIFGKTSWYQEDPVYREWREKVDMGVEDVSRSYKDPAMVNRMLRAYHEAFPDVTELETLGQTHQGREILALNITDFNVPDNQKPSVFLNGAHHGHELLSIEYTFDAIDQILQGWKKEDARMQAWVRGLDIWVVPVVNPDGLWITTHLHHGNGGESLGGRKNGRNAPSACASPNLRIGVDLNRNYPYGWGEEGSSGDPSSWKYRGPKAGSEPETRAIMDLARREHFVTAITYHTVGPMVLTPYTLGGRMNPEPDVAWAIAEAFAPPGFPVKSSMYPVSGTDQDWLYHEFGTLAYIFEGSRHNPLSAEKRKKAVKKARPAFGDLFDQILKGPRVSGYVTNKAGEPVQALIEVEGYQTYNGEKWTSRPDGRFDRMLIRGGEYKVTVKSLDGKVQISDVISTRADEELKTIVLDIPAP